MQYRFSIGCGVVSALVLGTFFLQAQPAIVINEVHYNPDVKTEPAEFIELFNRGTNGVDLSGWQLRSAVDYTFPAGAAIAGRGYVVVAQNPAFLFAKFGARALGPYTNQLSKAGEKIVLSDQAGKVVNEVNYQLGFPWPTVGDPPGYSIELINPDLDNTLGGSWRASLNGSPIAQSQVLLPEHSIWKYRKGTNEASAPTTAWRQPDFDDTSWSRGPGPIGFDPSLPMGTRITDMEGNYTSMFLRSKFVVTNLEAVGSVLVEAMHDDGFKLWINGAHVLNANIATNELPFDGVSGPPREDGSYKLFSLNAPGSFLVPGTNVIAVQAHNAAKVGNNDFYIDIRLRAQYGPPNRGPTPGAINAVYAAHAPPQIRQAAHEPEQPAAGQAVRITAKITDRDGVAAATLQYQVVEPGNYIELSDAAYTNNWVTLPMRDDGAGGDELAGDDTYTAEVPASAQQHRRLIRYRITARDAAGLSVRVPYGDDPQPNFAYFVYNGVPAWSAAVRPGSTTPLTFSREVMGRLPVYHLIAKSNSVATATWFSRYSGQLYPWAGTLVYEGKVYDHIHYRARGGVWRYSMCKNMWKFDLNRGHDLEARDNWGHKYKTAWTKLNLGACIQQGDFNHRGEQGMFESIGFRLLQFMGVTAPNTTFTTFRVIDDALEADPKTQYEGDFWGLYLAIEQEGGRYLEEHGLPDGNFYKMEGGTGELNNLGPLGPIDKSDLNGFLNTYSSATNASLPDGWWRAHFNLARYYGYQCVVQAVHHYDIADGKNYFYYVNPETGVWEVFPWDLDLTWADNMYRGGQTGGDEPFKSRVLGNFAYPGARPALSTEFRNRVREFRDLMWNSDQVFKMIDEHAALARGPTNGPTLLEADRSMWDYNPKMNSGAYSDNPGSKAGTGRFYQWPSEPTVSKDFNGCLRLMKNYAGYRATNATFSLDTIANEPLRPNRPTLAATGPTNFPAHRLSFRASTFSSPYPTNQFAAVKWRLAEVTDPACPAYDPRQPWVYEITPVWESGPLTTFSAEMTIPAEVARLGHRYRARVQMLDKLGRASNWSLPVEFTCGEVANAAELIQWLRLTELMYNPAPGGYEFLELRNTSSSAALDLSGARFTAGIDYTFPPGTRLPPGGYLLVIGTADEAAFRAYYGLDESAAIAGPYSGALNNGGETVTLRTAGDGSEILSLTYKNSRGWPAEADGAGHSLVLRDGAQALEGAGAADYGDNWRASTFLNGSPGRADLPPPPSVVLNEIAAHTHDTNDLSSNDWIELYNPTDAEIDLGSGWYLSDDGARLKKWVIPPGTVLRARDWLSFDELTGFHNPPTQGFGLSQAGEAVFLSYLPGTAEDRIVDSVVFKGQELDWSWGRFPDGAPAWCGLWPATRGGPNAAPPPQVVISEVMYHPPGPGGTNNNTLDEFIELFNPTAGPAALFNTNGGWRIDGGVSLVFPTNLTLDAGAYLVLVGFDPATNVAQLAAFRATYGLGQGKVAVLGPYSGALNNDSDRVGLERLEAADPAGSPACWVVVDELIYAAQPPWPCGADGAGQSLQRLDALLPGNWALNWTAEPPTPGAPRNPLPPAPPTIRAQPSSLAVATNGLAAFNVALCGTRPFSFQWRFNEAAIPGATNAEFTLDHAGLSDAGEYRVVVANAAGAVTSQVARLSVLLPPALTAQPQAQNIMAGQDVSFGVAAEGGAPLQYQWRVNGANLAGATGATLLLTNAQAWQAGRYTVVVFNAAGAVASTGAVLTVNVPAAIVLAPAGARTNAGSNVTFAVSAVGSGSLRYQWQLDGMDLAGATLPTLALTNVQPADAGSYTVRVSNEFASTTSPPAVLIVLYGPTVIEPPQHQTVALGSAVTMRVKVEGTLPISYRWRRNGGSFTVTPPATNSLASALVFTNAQFSNAAAYSVYMTNFNTKSAGVSSPVGYLTVVDPPTNQWVCLGTNVTFSLLATGRTVIHYQWQFNGANLAGATNNNLDIPNVGPAAAGMYAVVVSPITNVAIPSATFSATLALLDAALDSDHDGMSNLDEYLAGTDPSDPQSVLKLTATLIETNLVRLSFAAVSNHTYSVLLRERLAAGPWQRLTDIGVVPTNRVIHLTNAIPAGTRQRYYRVVTPRAL